MEALNVRADDASATNAAVDANVAHSRGEGDAVDAKCNAGKAGKWRCEACRLLNYSKSREGSGTRPLPAANGRKPKIGFTVDSKLDLTSYEADGGDMAAAVVGKHGTCFAKRRCVACNEISYSNSCECSACSLPVAVDCEAAAEGHLATGSVAAISNNLKSDQVNGASSSSPKGVSRRECQSLPYIPLPAGTGGMTIFPAQQD